MLWSDFHPYIAHHVIGCPDPLMERYARMAAIEFCRRTACWQKTLDPVLTDGTTVVSLVPDANTQVIKIKGVEVDGSSYPIVDAKLGLDLVRTDSQQSFCFTQDNKTLNVYPVKVVNLPVVVDAVLAPTITATSIDDGIGNDYIMDIATGAAASLQRISDSQWTDMNSSQINQAVFNGRMATVASKVARGFIDHKMPSYASFI